MDERLEKLITEYSGRRGSYQSDQANILRELICETLKVAAVLGSEACQSPIDGQKVYFEIIKAGE